MTVDLVHWLSSDNGMVVHIAVFVLLILGGFGFPMPEDIPIGLAGVAASKQIVQLHSIFVTAYVGVVAADQVVYAMGYFLGPRILNAGVQSSFLPWISHEKIESVRDGLRRRRFLYIFIGRHFFPVRTAIFLSAGALRVPYLEFLLADSVAALISVALIIYVGYYLGGQLTPEVIQHLLHESHWYIAALCGALIAGLVVKKLIRRRSANRMMVRAATPDQEATVLRSNEVD